MENIQNPPPKNYMRQILMPLKFSPKKLGMSSLLLKKDHELLWIEANKNFNKMLVKFVPREQTNKHGI
jgi:hypothetical protein